MPRHRLSPPRRNRRLLRYFDPILPLFKGQNRDKVKADNESLLDRLFALLGAALTVRRRGRTLPIIYSSDLACKADSCPGIGRRGDCRRSDGSQGDGLADRVPSVPGMVTPHKTWTTRANVISNALKSLAGFSAPTKSVPDHCGPRNQPAHVVTWRLMSQGCPRAHRLPPSVCWSPWSWPPCWLYEPTDRGHHSAIDSQRTWHRNPADEPSLPGRHRVGPAPTAPCCRQGSGGRPSRLRRAKLPQGIWTDCGQYRRGLRPGNLD
jgi:hypothetical protein